MSRWKLFWINLPLHIYILEFALHFRYRPATEEQLLKAFEVRNILWCLRVHVCENILC